MQQIVDMCLVNHCLFVVDINGFIKVFTTPHLLAEHEPLSTQRREKQKAIGDKEQEEFKKKKGKEREENGDARFTRKKEQCIYDKYQRKKQSAKKLSKAWSLCSTKAKLGLCR